MSIKTEIKAPPSSSSVAKKKTPKRPVLIGDRMLDRFRRYGGDLQYRVRDRQGFKSYWDLREEAYKAKIESVKWLPKAAMKRLIPLLREGYPSINAKELTYAFFGEAAVLKIHEASHKHPDHELRAKALKACSDVFKEYMSTLRENYGGKIDETALKAELAEAVEAAFKEALGKRFVPIPKEKKQAKPKA